METLTYIGEIWRPVKGYEGLYEVSNFERVRSLGKYWKHPSGKLVYHKGRILSNGFDGRYLFATLYKEKKRKTKGVQRIVAEAFIPVPEHLKHIPIDDLEVNHKNENKLDNFVYVKEDGSVDLDKSNLEWCTHIENCNHGTRNKRIGKKRTNNPLISNPVNQYTLNGVLIAHFPSYIEAERQTGVKHDNISRCCNGKRKTAGTKGGPKFIWKNAE